MWTLAGIEMSLWKELDPALKDMWDNRASWKEEQGHEHPGYSENKQRSRFSQLYAVHVPPRLQEKRLSIHAPNIVDSQNDD